MAMEAELEQALQIFLEEGRELLQGMEESLLTLESNPDDDDAINSVFRAAHTIKGSAGLFGLDEVVKFTHVVENVLDRVRSRELRIDSELIALLLKCRDQIAQMIERIALSQSASLATLAEQEQLLHELRRYLQEEPAAMAVQTAQPAPRVEVSGGGEVASDTWHITVRFGEDLLRNGMDPLSFIRYLRTLGDISAIVTLFDTMPAAAAMDAESCYLGFEISLDSSADKQAIESAFEFVRDDCTLHILPPHSKIADYIKLIDSMGEAEARLGDILVQIGAVTDAELAAGLQQQGRSDEERPRLGAVLVEQQAVPAAVVDAALEKQRQGREARSQECRYVRVQAEKLDQLINMVGELVIASDGIHLHAQRLNDEGLHETSSLIGRLVSEIRDGALLLRMVQIGETFNRFHRVVRDVSRELGKEIRLEISGADTELDKSVVEKIGDPLMHLVRNAMDHGIEAAPVRLASSKPPAGTLQLNAYHDAGSIVIEVADDGAGINTQRVVSKAIERGLVAPGAELTQQQICNLIFEPGFSTAETVTNLSGRGVGMDVVRRNIEALRGTVEMESRAGQGTTARIRLPLTLAIIDAFLMGVENGTYVVPLESVVECVELDETMRRAARGNDYIILRDEILPFLRLREVFDVGSERPALEYVVVVQFGAQRAGLVVDRLLGELQAVIKPIAKLFGTLRGIGGTTILGSGEVALLLDVPALIQQAVSQASRLEQQGSGCRAVLPAEMN